MVSHYTLKNCRLCGSNKLEIILTLSDSPLCDAYVLERKPQDNYPLALNLCMNCSFVQLNSVIDPEVIYKDYIYVTTSSSGLDQHFSNYCNDVCNYLNIPQKSLVVDIGRISIGPCTKYSSFCSRKKHKH